MKLKAERNINRISVLVPVIKTNGMKKYVKFFMYVNSLNKLFKLAVKQPNGLMRFRLKFQLLRDIHLGEQIMKKMKTYILPSLNLKEITKTKISSNKRERTKPISSPIRHVYLDHYHHLRQVTKFLLDRRFVNTNWI